MSSPSQSIILTPRIKRRKKISLSPVKMQNTLVQPRSLSSPAVRHSELEPLEDGFVNNAAVEFDEFSCYDEKKGFLNVPKEHQKAFDQYLIEAWNCYDYSEAGPYLILNCKTVPDVETRPFTIVGLVAIWLHEDEAMPPEIGLGDLAEGDEIALPEDITNDLSPYRLPSARTLAGVARQFPNAEYVTFLNTGLIIELREQTIEAYQETLQRLPGRVTKSQVTLYYHNGPLATTEMARQIKPDPRLIDGTYDNTNYVQNNGLCYPGVMLSSSEEKSFSAGILIRKKDQTRLTGAFHSWADEYKDHADRLGDSNHFQVKQGEHDSGTSIGYVAERFQESNICLIKLNPDIEFRNKFMDIDTDAKFLLRSNDVRLGDEFMIDAFVTGRQMLKCLGRRRRNSSDAREKDFVTTAVKKEDLPGRGMWIRLIQGIYATSTPITKQAPMIRAGLCGSAIVRSRQMYGDKKGVLDEGGVAGFMQFSELRPKSIGDGKLLCFFDSVDNLIEEGWEVVKVVEKRKAEVEQSNILTAFTDSGFATTSPADKYSS